MILTWTNAAGELESVDFDATPREIIRTSSTATEHAVEEGADVSDHVRPNIIKASFDCFVSDSPSQVPTTQMFGVTGSRRPASLDGGKMPVLKKGAQPKTPATYAQQSIKGSASVLQFDGPFARRERVYEQLEALRVGKTPCTATCVLRQLTDVVITDIGAMLDGKTGDGITFSLELTQLRFATSQIVEVPDPVEPRAVAPGDGGAISGTEQPPESLWFQGARALGVGL